MKFPLVSVISPCYNVELYIERFLDSLIAQTYKNLEIILVNDGSTDNTGEIIKKYIPKLKAEAYKVLYLEQNNQGQSAAINNALKHVTGKYLTWPDPDDWFSPESIATRVDFLEQRPDIGLVRCNAEIIDERTLKTLGFFEKSCNAPCIISEFFDKLVSSNTWFGAMCCMIRMDYFDKAVPDREIYVEKNAGQNWQMILPIAQKYPCWQLPDILAYYLVRENSHSHSASSFEHLLSYSNMCENVLHYTLSRLNASKSLIDSIHSKYTIQRLEYSRNHANLKQRIYCYLEAINYITSPYQKILMLFKSIIPRFIYKLAKKIKNSLKDEKKMHRSA